MRQDAQHAILLYLSMDFIYQLHTQQSFAHSSARLAALEAYTGELGDEPTGCARITILG